MPGAGHVPEPVGELTRPVQLEHAAVGGGRGVERDLPVRPRRGPRPAPASVRPVITSTGQDSSKPVGRAAIRGLSCSWATRREVSGCATSPSATAQAAAVIRGPTAASSTRGSLLPDGPGRAGQAGRATARHRTARGRTRASSGHAGSSGRGNPAARPSFQQRQIARNAMTNSVIRSAGWSNAAPNRRVMWAPTWGPRPRLNRPAARRPGPARGPGGRRSSGCGGPAPRRWRCPARSGRCARRPAPAAGTARCAPPASTGRRTRPIPPAGGHRDRPRRSRRPGAA